MTSMTLGKRRRRQGFPVLQIISIIAILLSVSLFVYYLVRFSQQEERLASDVSVAGVPVGGLSAREAMSQLVTAYQQPVVLYYAESPILLDPSQIGFRVNAESMLASASAAGDLSGSFWGRFINFMLGRSDVERVNVPLSAEYQQTLLEQMLNDISRRYDRLSGEASYDLTTLTLRPGAAGFSLDKEAALRLIDEALRRPINRVVNLPFVESGINIGNIGTLKTMIEDYLDSKGFIFDGQTTIASVYILDLRTGEEVNINGDVAFSAASTIKVPILVDYYRHLWVSPTQDEAWLMANSLLCSNNSSSNLLMQITGERINTLNNTNTGDADTNLFTGLADVNRTIQYAGAVNTFITAPLFLGVQGQTLGSIPAPQTSPNPNLRTNADPYNQITAEDIGTIFNMIYDCANYGSGLMTAYPDGEFTQLECKQMIELMSVNNLSRLLQGGLPDDVRISHKNGWVNDMSGDAGIVFPPNGRDYIIAVYLWEQTDFQDYTRLWPLIEDVSRAAWNYFSPDTPLISPRPDLPPTAQDCIGNYLPPSPADVNLEDMDAWKQNANTQTP
ncbi:MAG: serine hydrolase [Anaerolineae bacterium]|nr:serine hydrolase [Anaerolineae bacterium]